MISLPVMQVFIIKYTVMQSGLKTVHLLLHNRQPVFLDLQIPHLLQYGPQQHTQFVVEAAHSDLNTE